jgi:hypothetical protein
MMENAGRESGGSCRRRSYWTCLITPLISRSALSEAVGADSAFRSNKRDRDDDLLQIVSVPADQLPRLGFAIRWEALDGQIGVRFGGVRTVGAVLGGVSVVVVSPWLRAADDQ